MAPEPTKTPKAMAPKTKPLHLSKSRFVSGLQCHLRLWNDCHERKLQGEASEGLVAIFEMGHRVGELATTRHPGGVLVYGEPWPIQSPLELRLGRVMGWAWFISARKPG